MNDNQLTMPYLLNEISACQCARPAMRAPAQHADVDQITILAHDLRNYLTPVYGQLTMLYGRAQREERELDMRAATRGRQALDYALILISNLLDTTRMERGVFDIAVQPLNLSLLAQQAAEVFHSDDTPVLLHMPETLLVSADRERLRQVVHNLLANAVTHSPHGAPVTIELTTERRGFSMWCVLKIRNQGPGIPTQLMPQLFQRFSAGPGSRGLGLGLYLARGIAEAHGGTLTAESREGAGACFTLALPLANDI